MNFWKKITLSNTNTDTVSDTEKTHESPVLLPPIIEDKGTIAKNQLPDWLQNEDLLRDEGVLFGLASASPDTKIGEIHQFFMGRTAGVLQKIEHLNERIGELNLWINQLDDRNTHLDNQMQGFMTALPQSSHQLLRVLVGLLLSACMCIGNYFLISESLKTSFNNNEWIAIGVFLAGMFNLFGNVSVLHQAENRFTFHRVLEEFGMPFATSSFVAVQLLQQQPIINVLALYIFVFFLFLFSGKLLLGNLAQLKTNTDAWKHQQRISENVNKKNIIWEAEIKENQLKMEKYRSQKQEILSDLLQLTTQIQTQNAHRDRLVQLFESEYSLARHIKPRLSVQQIRDISENG